MLQTTDRLQVARNRQSGEAWHDKGRWDTQSERNRASHVEKERAIIAGMYI